MSTTAAQAQPHSTKWGGLREHSVGPTYPFTVQGWGDDTWQVFNATTGRYHGERTTLDEAHALAQLLSVRRKAARARSR